MSIVSVNSEQKVISIRGNLNKTSIEDELRDSLQLNAGSDYDIDMALLKTFDSAGLAYLVNQISQQKKTGGELRLINCSEQVLQLIELSELDDILSIKSN